MYRVDCDDYLKIGSKNTWNSQKKTKLSLSEMKKQVVKKLKKIRKREKDPCE